MVRRRVRMRFCKQGDLRWIGHRDLLRCLERWFRRAWLPLSLSEGFHPKPRMTFPSALAVGIEATDEVMELELELDAVVDASEVRGRLDRHAVPGLSVNSVEVLPVGSRKARVRKVRYQVPVPAALRPGLTERVEALRAAGSFPAEHCRRPASLDVRPPFEELSFREGVLSMGLKFGVPGAAGPRDVLAALGLGDLERHGVHLTRTRVEIDP